MYDDDDCKNDDDDDDDDDDDAGGGGGGGGGGRLEGSYNHGIPKLSTSSGAMKYAAPRVSKCHARTSMMRGPLRFLGEGFVGLRIIWTNTPIDTSDPSLLEDPKPCHCSKSCLSAEFAKAQNVSKSPRLEVESYLFSEELSSQLLLALEYLLDR